MKVFKDDMIVEKKFVVAEIDEKVVCMHACMRAVRAVDDKFWV